jgi:hypothetical protein
MVPVIVANAAASNAPRSGSRLAMGRHVAVTAPCGDPGNRARSIEAAEKLFFNIGRIPVRQSRQPVLRRPQRQILPPGRKGMPYSRSAAP